MTQKEGIIKYQCIYQPGMPPDVEYISSINKIRNELHKKGLIGVDANNIGYGNISIRYGTQNKFIISGTQTGHKETLGNSDYSIVTDFNIDANKLYCTGKIRASSESLTHAAIYQTRPDAMSVIHIHSRELWEKYIGKIPTTDKKFEYGTPGIALAVAGICSTSNNKVIVLGGHPEGIIAYGKNPDEAFVNIMNLLKK